MKTKLTQNQMLNLVLKDLVAWIDSGGGDSDCSMVFAYNNGYHLHAANLWLGTGAAGEDVCRQVRDLRISRAAELREIKQLCAEATIYVCPSCNHHGFREDDDGETVTCFLCGADAKRKDD